MLTGRTLLGGIARCGLCGARMMSGSTGGYRTLRCSATPHVSRRADIIDRVVEMYVGAVLFWHGADLFPESEGMLWSEWRQSGQAIVDRALDALDMSARREIVKAMLAVEVFPVGRGCRTFALDSVRLSPAGD